MEKDKNLEKFLAQEQKSLSENISGIQSGWTLYLASDEEEEKSLSMLSDASSGPPHINKDDYFNIYYCSNVEDDCISSSPSLNVNTFAKTEGNKKKQRRNQEISSFLDDTASSPCFSKKDEDEIQAEDVMDLSCGFSVNHFNESRKRGSKTALKKER